MPQLTKIIFSWDRPLQLWGLIKSALDNTDLKPEQIRVICKCSNAEYRKAYQTVSKELGCQIIYQGNAPLWNLTLAQIQGNEFVAFSVDDMMFFRKASYSEAIEIMQNDPRICLWSWRIGSNIRSPIKLRLYKNHWTVLHAKANRPYNYLFHTDSSLYRKKDFEYWLRLIPKQHRANFNLNRIESYLMKLPQSVRQNLGSLHAGPLKQVCLTWRINKVSGPYGSIYHEINQTKPEYLRKVFEKGGRLDYSSLYERVDWLQKLNVNWSGFSQVAATKESANFFTTLIQ